MAKRRLNRYLVAQPYVADRLTDETLQEDIVNRWTYYRCAPHLHSNLSMHCLYFSTRKRRFELGDRMSFFSRDAHSAASVISSSLAVYRLMCIFKRPPRMSEPNEIYKTLWEYPLKHKATGHYLTLLDSKAGFNINTQFSDLEDLPPEFASDLLSLLNFLISNQVAHPYDGTLAGTVA
jgi:hypothetical protein